MRLDSSLARCRFLAGAVWHWRAKITKACDKMVQNLDCFKVVNTQDFKICKNLVYNNAPQSQERGAKFQKRRCAKR